MTDIILSCSGTTQSNIHPILIQFCQEENFKKYVRNAINDELFWRNIFQQFQLDSEVESKVKKHTSTFKEEIRNEVREKLLDYTQNLSGQIARELNNQVPTFLNN